MFGNREFIQSVVEKKPNIFKKILNNIRKLAEKMKSAKIENAVFDRNGYLYHGVVASFGEALKANGIKL